MREMAKTSFASLPITRYLFALLGILLTSGMQAADWPMRGKDSSRNPVVVDEVDPIEWEFPKRENKGSGIRWSAQLGYLRGPPVIQAMWARRCSFSWDRWGWRVRRRSMRWVRQRWMSLRLLARVASCSRPIRRKRPSQPKVRSTIQR